MKKKWKRRVRELEALRRHDRRASLEALHELEELQWRFEGFLAGKLKKRDGKYITF